VEQARKFFQGIGFSALRKHLLDHYENPDVFAFVLSNLLQSVSRRISAMCKSLFGSLVYYAINEIL